MNPGAIPLLQMLKGRLGYLSDRQSVVAQNVANVDTPGFKPSDLTPFAFKVGQAVSAAGAPTRTQAMHLPGTISSAGAASGARVKAQADSETTMDGNSVVLEEQMMKMADARMNYDAAISFYQRSMGLLKLAARKPGQG